jgi:ABC-type nitrate/sulfonate/bicarbonate transport system permease component
MMVIDSNPELMATAPQAPRRGVTVGLRLLRGLGNAVITFVVVIGAWLLFLKAFNVSPFIGKGPLDVWNYLFSVPGASANRAELLSESGITLRDAGLGLAAGTTGAVLCAMLFSLSRLIAGTFMPFAMVLRAVPLVPMTPLIVGVFGRSILAIAVVAGIITFFPTLINVNVALKSASPQSLDLCRAYGASPLKTLWKAQMPGIFPALFASMRIAAPLALVGALIAEWLATGQGLGYQILTAAEESDYTGLWSRVALMTLYSILIYKVVGVIESAVVRRVPTGSK